MSETKDVAMADAVSHAKQPQTLVSYTPKHAQAKPDAPRFEIKKWNAVAMWSWDICADTVRSSCFISFCSSHSRTVRHLPQLPQRAVH